MRITLDDVQRYLNLLPEPAREKYLRENGEAIRFLYDREKQREKEDAFNAENENT